MRGALDPPTVDVPVPVALASLLPAIYLDSDPVIQVFAEALDRVLAPVWTTLDCIDSYFDPRHAPADFLRWLSTWVGLPADGNWDTAKLRRLVFQAFEMFRRWGTRDGIVALVEASEGVTPQIIESGGVVVSLTPDGMPPPDGGPVVTVVVDGKRTPAESARLERLVRSALPPHLTVTVRAP